jgi:hypothetical protein
METDMSEINSIDQAYDRGRRTGLAIGALAASLVAFISLLGLEKALLALTLAFLALSGAPRGGARRMGRWAIGISCVYIVTYVVVLIVFHRRIEEFVHQLQRLS